MSRLTDRLLEDKFITQEQLKDALDKQAGAKRPIQDLLLEMEFVSEEDLLQAMGKISDAPIVDLSVNPISPSATKLVPYKLTHRYGVFPVRVEGTTLVLAMSDPSDVIAIDDISALVGLSVKPVLSTKTQILKTVENYYHMDETLYDMFKNVEDDAQVKLIPQIEEEKIDLASIEEIASPVVRLANMIISDAVKLKASDIHIEPQGKFIGLRYRIDGVLKNIMKIPGKLLPHLVARIKITANLDITERRRPQDGRAKVRIKKKNIDLRISIIPTYYGEEVVIRILDSEEAKLTLDSLGFSKGVLALFARQISKPQGIILATGPTGSGKTSTIYAALNAVRSETKNIITVEDPIEYLIEGVNQMQVNPKIGVTFSSGLRTLLRQDPDIILVGEIRDKETAEIAFRASLTGHLVFSSLHTNTAVAAITRLIDIGVEPFLIASSLNMVLAQNLVRVNCPFCKEPYTPNELLLERFSSLLEMHGDISFLLGKGCEKCDFNGYAGRTAILEIFILNTNIRSMLSAGAPEIQIFEAARKDGMMTMAEAAFEKVAQGVTTLEEVAGILLAGMDEGPLKETLLPTAPEQAAQEEPSAGEKAARILVVDDNKLIRKKVIKALGADDFAFKEAENGEEALRINHAWKPDLMILDIMMPKMNGFEVLKTLRSHLEHVSLPVIMLTAQDDKESELKGLSAGADDYITKPFDPDKLLARVNLILRRRSLSS